MIEVNLYYDESVNYAKTPLDQILRALDELNRAKGQLGVSISKLERKVLSERKLKKIEDDIRSIKPQARGSVVTSGGYHLPLSGTKKLNLNNTPILLVRNGSGPLYVFPCKSGEIYYDVMGGIKFLHDNLPNLIDLPSGTEESVTSVILRRTELLEEGLSLVSSEIETSRGRGDLLFKDKNGRLLLVEVEREAHDQSVGQILRLCAGYESQHGLELGTIRAAIACIRINDNVLAAAKRAGIEVWKIPLPRKLDGNNEPHQEAAEYFLP
jgi:hypothetical protein